MAIRQVFKGNPTAKDYVILNDFSGGMNTTDIDDVVNTNEFRVLKNVELSTYGLLQNRKGFGNMTLLNLILANKSVTIPTGDYRLVKVIKDTNNCLDRLEDYDNVTSFCNGTTGLLLGFTMLLIVDVKLYTLKFSKSASATDLTGITITLTEKANLSTGTGTVKNYPKRVTAIRTVDHIDKVYFTLSDVNDGLSGIGVYDSSEDTYSVIDGEHCYEPSPAEIVNFEGMSGFNALATSPLEHVGVVDTTVQSVQGIYLTTGAEETVVLNKIPTSGEFTLNILVTGDLSPAEIRVVFRDFQGREIPHYKTFDIYAVEEGLIPYSVQLVGIVNTPYITIDITKNKDIVEIDDAGQFEPIKGWFGGKIFYLKETETYYEKDDDTTGRLESEFSFWADQTRYTYITVPNVDVIDWDEVNGYDIDFGTPVPRFVVGGYYAFRDNYKTQFTVVAESAPGVIYFDFLMQDVPHYDHWYNVIAYMFNNAKNNLIHKLDDDTYWVRNEYKPMEGIWDYVKLTNYNPTTDFTPLLGQRYDVGNAAVTVTGLDLNGVGIVEMWDRLVYYKGNTLWFSELGQFDYLPNSNFVILPIEAEDEITSIHYFRGVYIVFTKDRIFKIASKWGQPDFDVKQINNFVGSIAPNAVRNINNSLIFMSKEGLYRLVNSGYGDELEYVNKYDKRIRGIVPITEQLDSVLYGEQYWILLRNGTEYDTVKNYYNFDTYEKQTAFTVDQYAIKPQCLFKSGTSLYSIYQGEFFIYDKGYTDFVKRTSEVLEENLYEVAIETADFSLGTPTHDKKFKSIFVKTLSKDLMPLYVTIDIDGYNIINPYNYLVTVNEEGEVEYTVTYGGTKDTNVNIDISTLGYFDLGKDKLGDSAHQTHKIVVGGKGKTIKLKLKQKSNGGFGISNIGYLTKLGKVKESR